MRKVYVYGLYEPAGGPIRYVGVTNDVKRRMISHKSKSKNKQTRLQKWVAKCLRSGGFPAVKILEVTDESNWPNREVHWIAKFKSEGFDLVNANEGGLGGISPNFETKMKMSLARTRYYQGVSAEAKKEIGKNLQKALAKAKSERTPEEQRELDARHSDWSRRNMKKLTANTSTSERSERAKIGHMTRLENGTVVRYSHCKKGHPLTEDNVSTERSRGGFTRRCKVCLAAKRLREKKKRKSERAILANPNTATAGPQVHCGNPV